MSINNLRRRFLKDYNLPINLVRDPYFDYFIELYDPHFKTKDKLEKLNDFLKYNTIEEFFVYGNSVSNKAIAHIKKKSEFQNFSQSEVDKESIKGIEKLYQEKNHGQEFLSLDFKKANFQILKHYNPGIIDNCDTYQDFLKQFTDHSYFLDSKYIRQVIFGNLSPAKQQKHLKSVVAKLTKDLVFNRGIKENDVVSINSDEIIIADKENYRNILETFMNEIKYDFRLEEFTLNKIHPEKNYYAREQKNGEYALKQVPKQEFAEVYKFYNKLPLTDYDLMFYHEGRIAKFEEPLLHETKKIKNKKQQKLKV